MKSILLFFVVLFFFSTNGLFAQQKILKYCEVKITQVGFAGSKTRVELITGEIDSLFSLKDENKRINLNKVTSLQTEPDILNYMNSIGWSFAFVTSRMGVDQFYFKTELNSSDKNEVK